MLETVNENQNKMIQKMDANKKQIDTVENDHLIDTSILNKTVSFNDIDDDLFN